MKYIISLTSVFIGALLERKNYDIFLCINLSCLFPYNREGRKVLKDIDEVKIIDIIKGDPEKDECYYAVRFAFWAVVAMLLIGAAVCIGVFIRSL
jgi:hypothetical protein